MSDFFNLDSPVFRFLARVFDYILVNFLFLLLCLPVLTAGPALTALYRCLLEAAGSDGSPSVKIFWNAFRQSFRYACLPGICFLLLGGILLGDLRIIGQMPSGVRVWLSAAVILMMCLLLGTGLFFFPLLAKNPTVRARRLWKPAFVRAVGLLPRTVCMAVLWLLPAGLFLFLPKVFLILTFLWLFLWFSLAAGISLRLIAPYLEEIPE